MSPADAYLIKKRKILYLLLIIILCYSLFPRGTRAQSSSRTSISSVGSITYSPSPSSTNLAPIEGEVYWSPYNPQMLGGWGLIFHDHPQFCFRDDTVLHNGHISIRIEPDYVEDRACIGLWQNLKPGDHIVLRVWIRTSASTTGRTDHWAGGRIGIDLYDVNGIVAAVSKPHTDAEAYYSWVPFGSDWEMREWDFIVPSGYNIVGCLPWLQVMPYTDGGIGWFADAEFYINP